MAIDFEKDQQDPIKRTDNIQSLADQVEKLDSINKKLILDISDCNSVSIHIRRGDYLNLKDSTSGHGLCSLDYYKEAIEFIEQAIASNNNKE